MTAHMSGRNFNPRAPYGARLGNIDKVMHNFLYFNPRAPYGARQGPGRYPAPSRNFNPRAPYGARQEWTAAAALEIEISIHAPHTGRDGLSRTCCITSIKFQSTRPIRGATINHLTGAKPQKGFQSTRPIRGATKSRRESRPVLRISIHAPHTGRDFTAAAGVSP